MLTSAGLVDASDFNHSAAASREWIAKLLIKIMKAESEVNSVANETLSFGDTNSIGSDYHNSLKLGLVTRAYLRRLDTNAAISALVTVFLGLKVPLV